MSTIGNRLKEERIRIGLSQSKLAETGGIQRRAQINYESDSRSPDGLYLEAISKVGIDVLYVISGQRTLTENALSPREHAFLNNYRHLSEEDKKSLEKVSAALVQLNNSSD